MNEQLDRPEPVDPSIREHLTRRSAGIMPEGFEAQVSKALDDAGARPGRVRNGWPNLRLTAPRLAGAGIGVALVAIMAVAILAPVLNRVTAGPGGYPYDRAMTTAELVALMANPPAVNTALVIAATIDIRSDVCPMDRYSTYGVIDGVDPQICVMQAEPHPLLTGSSVTGTFAIRYLGPGYVGLLGEITPASTGNLPFRVADEWPTDGDAFLVEGWLTQLRFPTSDTAFCSGGTPVPAGDPLNPTSDDPCVSTWLNDAASPAPTRIADGLTFPKEARGVDAAGAGEIDNLGGGDALYGLYVLRAVAKQCSVVTGQATGVCTVWQVLARVADLSVPSPTGTVSAAPPTASPATASPSVSGPLAPALTGIVGQGGRPLTAAELDALWKAKPSSMVGRIAVVAGPIQLNACPAAGSAEPSGFNCAGEQITAGSGYWAVRVGASGTLTSVGRLPDTNASPLPLSAADRTGKTQPGQLTLVDAWLDWVTSFDCDTPPYPSDSLCGAGAAASILSSDSRGFAAPSGATWFYVGLGAYQIYGSSDLNARPIHGLYLLWGTNILARMEPVATAG